MTEQESIDMAVRAVAIYAARHPRPLHVTITQAAEMLGRSRPTVRKMLLENRVRSNAAGSIPIEAIDRLLASRV
ncbi:DNA-binding protein [Paraburkholderia acidicola]|uniref:DNA-binding protein n=1 Tax=Paraburkholderia acidicola TaxID=1912599 RepID=A0A2A4F3H4_9BURK|nr:DNA-binding protein [Paraburkholderia acidicola]